MFLSVATFKRFMLNLLMNLKKVFFSTELEWDYTLEMLNFDIEERGGGLKGINDSHMITVYNDNT